MDQRQLTDKLKEELIRFLANSSGAERKKWIEYIVNHNILLTDLVDILYRDYKTAMKFSWIVGSLCELDSTKISPIVNQIFTTRHKIKIPNFDRTIAKIFYLVEIPQEIEGDAVNIMFNWLLDPKIIVSTKNYSLFALYDLTKKYPDLKIELREVIEDQLNKNSNDFKKRAIKILQKLL
jgi:hypothetical protein